jgi:hypothetical protein
MAKRGLIISNKKGMELAFSSIVYIILAILILISLFIFFSGGFQSFKEKINMFISQSNVDNTIQSCNNLALIDAKYEYCCINKTVKISSKEKYQLTCYNLANKSWGKDITVLDCKEQC